MPPEQLQSLAKRYGLDPRSPDPQPFVQYLIQNNHLSQFQAEKLLAGISQGLVLGPYQVLAPLGRGGMGSMVYLAKDTRGVPLSADTLHLMHSKGSMLVALKVLPPKKARQEERVLARFQREMELCRRVAHPHLTKTFEAGVIDGIYYIAMEYIRGGSLHHAIATGGPMPVPRVASLFSEVAEGLAHAHQQGLIHRDLKPSNIMITPNGHAKILDLGLALAEGETLPTDKTIVGGKGYVVGTMDYIAPEQAEDPTKVDARSDLYSLGCSMYFALTGQPPFPGGTSVQKIMRHLREYPTPITDLNPTVPVEFAAIVEHLMAKHPSRRPANAEVVRQLLQPWAAQDTVRPMDVSPYATDADLLHAIEAEHATEASVWESFSPIVFAQSPGPTKDRSGVSGVLVQKRSGSTEHGANVTPPMPPPSLPAPTNAPVRPAPPPLLPAALPISPEAEPLPLETNPGLPIYLVVGGIGLLLLLEILRRL